ncbi:CHAD domain-containing protein [Glycomyces tritici]|uniref:CHAD domain-containing protein n=1 Tax=Glycomyces tritici TaxID=2665176 RepID=A0ABT7YQI3_9ACTN|nr:CHAD domain-containing protein [Glycomyces tritici]MDN3240906.1 CHAD domain-containing protein [Glycomyces tritici]MDN3242891.1 CHAD domain-containing protein [Glycomyces tritici]
MSAPAAPAKAGPQPMTASTRAGVVVQTYISDHVDALNRAIAAFERQAPGSAGTVRVTIHQLRTVIRGYAHLFTETPPRSQELDHLLEALKHTEDLEKLRVHFSDRFDQLALEASEHPKWYAALEYEMRESYRQTEGIASQTWVAVLLSQVRLFTEHARLSRDGDKPASSLMGVLSQARTHLLDTYGRLSHATDLVLARDETRIAAREAHYLAEAAAPALGQVAMDVVAPMADLERLLDRYRQAVIARNWLLRLPGADRADRLTASLAELEKEHLRQLGEEIDRAASEMAERWS